MDRLSSDQQKAVAYGAAGLLAIAGANALATDSYGNSPLGRTFKIFSTFSKQEESRDLKVKEWIGKYNDLHEDSLDNRNADYSTLVNNYYELATSFYEWGWGQSFHFAYQLPKENFREAIARHEYYLAGQLQVQQGEKVLDCGCGIGGPMRNIARFTRANITGVTLSSLQVARGNDLNAEWGLADTAKLVQADFLKLPFENNSFDGVYAIEATCHAPEREKVYSEIYRVLKPGKVFACYEWCLTPLYDKNNELHRTIKKKIEEGDGLPDMASQDECVKAVESVGFKMMEARDMALDETFGGDPWWLPLHPSWNPFTFRFQLTGVGKWITRNMLWALEGIWLVPPGTYQVQEMLQQGGWGCATGGFTGTFTPMWLMVARKPAK